MAFCAFPGCDNPPSKKASGGLCNSHYWQKHKGRELTPLSYRRNRCVPWLETHSGHDGDECLIWPFQRLQADGRGAVKYKGKQTLAARVMCELAHGAPPTPKHEAAHSCGKGHLGCVNPKHLRWATSAENKADMLVHGTRVRGERQGAAKLTTEQVLAIRGAAAIKSQAHLAREYGVMSSTIHKIIHRQRWGHV